MSDTDPAFKIKALACKINDLFLGEELSVVVVAVGAVAGILAKTSSNPQATIAIITGTAEGIISGALMKKDESRPGV